MITIGKQKKYRYFCVMKSSMQVTFLGTGTSQGIPVIGSDHPVCLSTDSKDKRLRVSVLLSWDNVNYVVDCGPDFRQQMLRENCKSIDGVLLTHEHSDHTAGLDDIRPYYFRQGNIAFYAEPRVFKALHERFAYIFTSENKYPGAPTIDEIEVNEFDTFMLNGKQVTPVRAMHGELPLLGYRIEDFTYLTDVKTIPSSELDKIRNTKVLVVNALREEQHYSHFNLSEALAFIEEVSPDTAYLTHISHKMGFHEEVSKKLPHNVHLAYDTLKLNI